MGFIRVFKTVIAVLSFFLCSTCFFQKKKKSNCIMGVFLIFLKQKIVFKSYNPNPKMVLFVFLEIALKNIFQK